MLATRVDGVIIVSPSPGQSEETHYIIDNNYHRLFLVRGDAAVGLHAGQPADSTRWYIYRWVDETALPAATYEIASVAASTWGRLKAIFR